MKTRKLSTVSTIVTLTLVMLLSMSGLAAAKNQFIIKSGLTPVFTQTLTPPVDFQHGALAFKVRGDGDLFTVNVRMHEVTGIPADATTFGVKLFCLQDGEPLEISIVVDRADALISEEQDKVKIKHDGVLSDFDVMVGETLEVVRAEILIDDDIVAALGFVVGQNLPEDAGQPEDAGSLEGDGQPEGTGSSDGAGQPEDASITGDENTPDDADGSDESGE